MNLDSIIKLLQENNVLAGYVAVGLLFLILLVFLLVKSFSVRKQPALATPVPQAMPKMQAQQPKAEVSFAAASTLVSEQPDTKIFLDQLKKVSDESQKVIYKLDMELTEKERIITEKKQYIQDLEQQIAEMPVEQILSQQAEKFKKDTEKKLAQAKQDASAKGYQMWFFGFLVGLAIAVGIFALYYFVLAKG